MSKITIWHNSRCSNSRGALELIRNAGFEPEVINYLDNPPDRTTLLAVLAATGLSPRELMRTKEPAYKELGLDNPDLGEKVLIDAMLKQPSLINRPVVITERGARLCRPPERVLEILPN